MRRRAGTVGVARTWLVVGLVAVAGCAELGIGGQVYQVTVERDPALPIRMQWQSAVEFGSNECDFDPDLDRVEIVWDGLSQTEAEIWPERDHYTCTEAVEMRNEWRYLGTNVLR